VSTVEDLFGEYSPVSSKYLREGDVILLSQGRPFTIVNKTRRHYHGPRLVVEDVQTKRRRVVGLKSTLERVYRLKLPRQKEGPAKDWRIATGDVVVYPRRPARLTIAAIRHAGGWYLTFGSRSPRSDAQIFVDVVCSRARVVRANHCVVDLPPDLTWRVGTVAAVRDLTVRDPTVWVRSGQDLWRSSTGVEASDQMIQFEMRRGTYHVVYAPGM
jgi:hypothetical protein